mmetsp:Transcript_19902/g.28507  ORF Transcript_19902/g.28507 Transcript_19902/m.28507 type:complete len:217 (+) Transcript_19902:566-1216(+)
MSYASFSSSSAQLNLPCSNKEPAAVILPTASPGSKLNTGFFSDREVLFLLRGELLWILPGDTALVSSEPLFPPLRLSPVTITSSTSSTSTLLTVNDFCCWPRRLRMCLSCAMVFCSSCACCPPGEREKISSARLSMASWSSPYHPSLSCTDTSCARVYAMPMWPMPSTFSRISSAFAIKGSASENLPVRVYMKPNLAEASPSAISSLPPSLSLMDL